MKINVKYEVVSVLLGLKRGSIGIQYFNGLFADTTKTLVAMQMHLTNSAYEINNYVFLLYISKIQVSVHFNFTLSLSLKLCTSTISKIYGKCNNTKGGHYHMYNYRDKIINIIFLTAILLRGFSPSSLPG